MVQTEVTVKGETKRMWLPIMDSHNASMKDEPYKVTVTSKKGSYDYIVPAVDAMALNKTIMRCLVKNLALFGLGLYIFSGEDLPNTEEETKLEGTVDPETGEVKVKEKKVETPKEDKKPMTEEDALVYCWKKVGEALNGHPVLELVTNSKNPEKSRNLLKSAAELAEEETDREAAALIIKMLDEGKISFPDLTQEKIENKEEKGD